MKFKFIVTFNILIRAPGFVIILCAMKKTFSFAVKNHFEKLIKI